MGIRSDVQEALTEAFDGELSDVIVEFSVIKEVKNATGYDVETDTWGSSVTEQNSRGVFDVYSAYEITGTSIKSTDEKLIINAVDLVDPPRVDDIIRVAGVSDYRIINTKPVMGGDSVAIVYELQIRKSNA